MRSLGMNLLAFAAVVVLATPGFAQTDTSNAKADVVFELRPSKLMDSPLGKQMDFKGKIEAMAAQAGPESPDLSKVDRLFVAMVAPEDMDNLQKIQQGQENKMEFLVRMEFKDADAAAKLMTEATKENGGVVEKNGKKYYRPPEGTEGMPESAVMYQVSDKIVELASGGFAYRTVEIPVTDALGAAWKTMPDEALKLSIDGVSARGLMKSLAKEGKKNAPDPVSKAVMDLFPTMDNINLSIDLSGANLLTMKMVGNDEDSAGDINDGFKSMVTVVKPLAIQGLGMLQAQAPGSAEVFGEVVNGMDVKQDGKNVTLHIPRAEGFEDATEEVIPILQVLMIQMMMGGMGGGPGGPPGGGF